MHSQAYDERIAAQTAGIDQGPLTQKEIVKHLEQFGPLGAGMPVMTCLERTMGTR